jgi:hypothetical protein
VRGGVVLSLERMNRILEIDQANLLAVVEPNVVTGDLQDAVERVGLFYPPDPSSLRQSAIGGNVAECAGGPRAFKYGTTKHYVLGLEAVLPTGEIIETGGKVVKNVVGYDLTHLLVGSEGTLAIITKVVLRLVPRPQVQTTIRACFTDVSGAVRAVTNIIKERGSRRRSSSWTVTRSTRYAQRSEPARWPLKRPAPSCPRSGRWSCRRRGGCDACRARCRDAAAIEFTSARTTRSAPSSGASGGSSRRRPHDRACQHNHDVVVPRGGSRSSSRWWIG